MLWPQQQITITHETAHKQVPITHHDYQTNMMNHPPDQAHSNTKRPPKTNPPPIPTNHQDQQPSKTSKPLLLAILLNQQPTNLTHTPTPAIHQDPANHQTKPDTKTNHPPQLEFTKTKKPVTHQDQPSTKSSHPPNPLTHQGSQPPGPVIIDYQSHTKTNHPPRITKNANQQAS